MASQTGMNCPRCQHENRPQIRFCEECGTALTRTCFNCGGPLAAAAKFCGDCGHSASGSASGPDRFTAPESYTPKHLAERILLSKEALEGERKQVTVLFADLKGSMELLADRDPEEARKLLDPVLEQMMEAVHRYEGTVNQVMGDGIMALFGAPLALEDHAVRACYAALRMQESVKRYAAEVFRTVVIAQQLAGVRRGRVAWVVLAAGLLCAPFGAAEPQADQDSPYVAEDSVRVDARTYAGWRAVRQFDCARCHGAQYQGSIGPSLVEAARTNTRAQFVRVLMEGNRDRGMPPYRDVRGVADNADGIYGYFRGRADGRIAGGMLELLR